MGTEAQEGGGICILMADSHCCAAETNTTLQSNYIPIYKKESEELTFNFQGGGAARTARGIAGLAGVIATVFHTEPVHFQHCH